MDSDQIAEVSIALPQHEDSAVSFAGVAGVAGVVKSLPARKVSPRELVESYAQRSGRSVAVGVRRSRLRWRAAADPVGRVDLTLPGGVSLGAGGLR